MPRPPLHAYTYANCSTCREAVQWLRAHGVQFAEHPIYTQPPAPAELRRMLAALGGQLRRLFNTSGRQYRALGLAERLPTLTTDAALALLAADGRLVKRPFVIGDGVGLVGFDAAQWAAALS